MEGLTGMKVLYVVTKSNWGGAQAYVYTLAKAAKEGGAEVAVALGGTGERGAPEGLLARRLKAAGIRTIFLSSFMRDIAAWRELSALGELRAVIRAEQPIVLHLNSSKAGGLGALAGRLEGVPRIIFTAHGWAFREPVSLPARAFRFIASWVTVLLCHTVITVSQLERRFAPTLLGRRKLVTIYNGISASPLLTREEARRKLAPGIRLPFWILTIAELHPNKGLEVLIRALARAHLSPIALVILGAGQEEEKLAELIRTLNLGERVHLAGFVEEARVYLSAADVFALPSYKEGLPFALLEAGVAGVPIIATPVGAVPEVIEDKVTGLLVPPGDISELSGAIQHLYAEPEDRARLVSNLTIKLDQHFRQETMLAKTAQVYLS